MIRQAAAMKRVAEMCNCVVLATNQVIPGSLGTTNSNDINNVMNDAIQGSSMEYRPALGPAWHHCITTRFVLTQPREFAVAANMLPDDLNSQSENDADLTIANARKIHLTKCPYLASFSRNYVINHRGFQVV